MDQNQIKGKKLAYLSCDAGGLHDGEALNYICIDPKCKNKGLQCSICLNQDHEKHNYMPLKIFLSQIAQSHSAAQSSTQDTSVEGYLEQIERLQQSNLYSLKQGIEKLAQQVKVLEETLLDTYKSLQSKIISQSYLSQHAPLVIDDLINGQYSDTKKIKEDCRQLVESIKISTIDGQEKIGFDFQPEKVVKNFQISEEIFQKQIVAFNIELDDQFTKMKKIFEKIVQNEVVSDKVTSPLVEFEPLKKFGSQDWVTIENPNLIKFKFRNEGSYTHINTKNTFSRNDKIKFRFKIVNYKYHNPSHLWVGICLDKHKDSNFWKTSGNQIDLLQKSQNWKTAWSLTGQVPGAIVKEGTIFELEFCVKENLMTLQDENKQCVCKVTSSNNLASGNSESDKWVICMGTHKSDVQIEIL